MKLERVILDQGSGGLASQRLINEVFVKHLGNPILNSLNDAALLELSGQVAMSTDTYTVDPLFFPGGDIGSLAVHGTVNDVAMLGARPRFLSCGFVLEEGFELDLLEKIVVSMGRAASRAGVQVVSGDTKVVPRGAVDKMFINTTGLGEVIKFPAPQGNAARPGDMVLVSGWIGDHGLTILATREGLSFETNIVSDSAPLNALVDKLVSNVPAIHVLRDPTRGGLATTINEIALQSRVGIELQEEEIPVQDGVREGCLLLGIDPLFLANEGKLICIVPEEYALQVLEIMHQDELGINARMIGKVVDEHPGQVVLKTRIGGRRLLSMLEGEQLPRIC